MITIRKVKEEDIDSIASLAGAEEVHALDLPSVTLNYARFRAKSFPLKTPIKFIESVEDISQLVLSNEHYDMVTAEDVFEHVSDPVAHAKKIHDALKRGDRCISQQNLYILTFTLCILNQMKDFMVLNGCINLKN